MEAMAQLMLKQSVSGLDSDGPTQGDVAGEIRLRELALEEKKMDAELKREQMKMELEMKVMDERRLEREAAAEAQREQKKMEMEMRKLELTEARAGRYEQYGEAEQAEDCLLYTSPSPRD